MKERKYDLQERFSESTEKDFSNKHTITLKNHRETGIDNKN